MRGLSGEQEGAGTTQGEQNLRVATSGPQARWNSEASFFDKLAAERGLGLGPLDPLTVSRYRQPRRSWFNKEFRFQLLGDLRGKRVLDLGCGEGSNAVLMALLGARVTGVDISPKSIELCNRQAELNGVEPLTHFICGPVETLALPDASFDVIWGDGVLHHLIPELDAVLEKLVRWAKPGARFIFSEPVSLSPLLRRLRRHVPIHTDATPDERPLEKAELACLRRHLPDMEMRWFRLLSRLDRFLLRQNYERAPLPRRTASDLLGRLDQAALVLRPLQVLGSMCVMYGRTPELTRPLKSKPSSQRALG